MKFKEIGNSDIIALVENTSELFRLGKYKSIICQKAYISPDWFYWPTSF